jgi:hypothetical protein
MLKGHYVALAESSTPSTMGGYLYEGGDNVSEAFAHDLGLARPLQCGGSEPWDSTADGNRRIGKPEAVAVDMPCPVRPRNDAGAESPVLRRASPPRNCLRRPSVGHRTHPKSMLAGTALGEHPTRPR